MTKIKLLFVVADFFQGGAERYAYEIDRAINKEKFEITILCLGIEKNANPKWNRFYDQEHLGLGTKIHYIDKFHNKKANSLETRLIKKVVRNYKVEYLKKDKILLFLEEFDLIHWMGEYTFFKWLPLSIVEKSIINSMSAKFQNPLLYKGFDFDYQYNFFSGFTDNEFEFEYSEFKKINHWFFPLVLNVDKQQRTWHFSDAKPKKIGIFTRLDKYKPLDPFFYSFQLLLEKNPDCELHIFGSGDPEAEGINRYIRNLNISDKVFFRGHQENIVKTLLEEKIALSWFQGYNNSRPAGYAGFDVCTTGTPLICWDFFDKPRKFVNEIYPHYKNLTQFVAKSIELLSNEASADKLSSLQFDDVKNNRDVNKKIIELENIYIEILNKIKK